MKINNELLVKTYDHGYKKILDAITATIGDEEKSKELLEKTIKLPERAQTINQLFERVLISAQNASGKPNIIGRKILGIKNLSDILFCFDPKKVEQEYKADSSALLRKIHEKFPNLKLNIKYQRTRHSKELQVFSAFEDPLNTWNKFSRTILDAAKWLSEFTDAEEFYKEVDKSAEINIDEFPDKIAKNISGIGYALACDFLKEVGVDFGKPDVHIKEILQGVLCAPGETLDNKKLQNAMRVIAENRKISLFTVDKVFWLIGTTRFSISICDYRESFVNECKEAFR
jgi:hypothetical protein